MRGDFCYYAVILYFFCPVLYWPDMYIGAWFVQRYTVRIALGALAGLLWLWFAGPRQDLSRARLTGLLWAAAGGALLGGRAGYVAANTAYFAQQPGDAVQFWRIGGLSGMGVWLGGLLGAASWSWRYGRALTATLTLLTPAALAIAAGAWWGCVDAGCAWGREALTAPHWLRWAAADGPDLYHTVLPRYAVQAASALWTLSLLPAALLLRRSGGLMLALYHAGIALLGGWRADPVTLVWGYRADSAVALLFALGIWALYWRGRQDNSRGKLC